MFGGSAGAQIAGMLALTYGVDRYEGSLQDWDGDDNLEFDRIFPKCLGMLFPSCDYSLYDYPITNDQGQTNIGNYLGLTWAESHEALDERAREFSLSRLLNNQYPKVRIAHGDADTVNPISQSQDFVTQMTQHGVDVTLWTVTGEGHDTEEVYNGTGGKKADFVSFFSDNL